jgi:hypothetical protein
MNRRECLQSLALAGGFTALPVAAQAWTRAVPAELFLYDSRFESSRHWGIQASADRAYLRLDCAQDAALLWYSNAPLLANASVIRGSTQRADAMILADCGRRLGFQLQIAHQTQNSTGIVEWTMRRESHD